MINPLVCPDCGHDTMFAQLDHAEAVAAKLVEVICDMDDDHQIDEQALRYVRNQRDAARAEVGRLQDLIGGGDWRIAGDVRAEVADEVEMRCQQIHHGAGDCPHCAPILRLIREAS